MQAWLSGKKTYLVALSAIIAAISAYAAGAITVVELVAAILAALGTCTLRAAVTKTGATE